MVKKYLLFLFVVMLIMTVGCSSSNNTVNVQGTSELSYEPNEAEVWVGVSVLKDNAEEAQNEANSITNAIIAGLQENGFEKIETQRLSLHEEKEWTQNEGSISVGWKATQTLKVKTSDMDVVGEIIDIAVSNGANTIQNINFGLTEDLEKEYKQLALAEATKNAKEKAETIAANLDAKLGNIVSVSEGYFNYMPYRYDMKSAVMGDMVEEAAMVMPQDVDVTANINLVYEIK